MSLSENGYFALQSMVTLAKGSSIRSLDELRQAMAARGYDEGDTDEAIHYWADHLRDRYPDAKSLRAHVS